MTYRKLRNRMNVLIGFNVLLAVLVTWLLLKPNPLQESACKSTEAKYVPTELDSLYREHLSQCAFVSKNMIEYDKNGYMKFKSWRFIRDMKNDKP